MRTNGSDEYRIKRGKIVEKNLKEMFNSGIPTPIIVIKGEISDRGTVHVN